MILIIVDSFKQAEDCGQAMATIHRNMTGRSYDWVFTKFRPDGTERLTVGSSQQRSTEFIELVAKADCSEVFIQQADFTELALQAARAITFTSGEHDIDVTRVTEAITVPLLS